MTVVGGKNQSKQQKKNKESEEIEIGLFFLCTINAVVLIISSHEIRLKIIEINALFTGSSPSLPLFRLDCDVYSLGLFPVKRD